MQEAFLHFIWRHQYFSKNDLKTTSGDQVSIFATGIQNKDAGPDFSNSKLKIGKMDWVGNVELHVKSSYWYNHKHDNDKAYDNVILHVVWEDDKPVHRTDGSAIPTLELKDKVDVALIQQSNKLVKSPETIPCSHFYSSIDKITTLATIDKAGVERLQRKADEVTALYNKTNSNWEETTYRLLCKNFGFKVNAQPFEQLAAHLPVKTLRKHSRSIRQIEALLFGQAGFLDKAEGFYQIDLQGEYMFLAHKYELAKYALHKMQWKFARLRPANFPTIRIAQLAQIITLTQSIFSTFVEAGSVKEIKDLLKSKPGEYWRTHYQFGKKAAGKVPVLGQSSIENIIINTIAPLLTAYGKSIDNQKYIDRAIQFLEGIKPENNTITRQWNAIGQTAQHAFDSQALIELYNHHCARKNCLNCNNGLYLLKHPLKKQ